MLKIDKRSDAGIVLADILAAPDTYCVRIDERENGVALKRNEGMWTPTLSTEAPDMRRSDRHDRRVYSG